MQQRDREIRIRICGDRECRGDDADLGPDIVRAWFVYRRKVSPPVDFAGAFILFLILDGPGIYDRFRFCIDDVEQIAGIIDECASLFFRSGIAGLVHADRFRID